MENVQRLAAIQTSSYLTANGNRKIKCSYGGISKAYFVDEGYTKYEQLSETNYESRDYAAVLKYCEENGFDWELVAVSGTTTNKGYDNVFLFKNRV